MWPPEGEMAEGHNVQLQQNNNLIIAGNFNLKLNE